MRAAFDQCRAALIQQPLSTIWRGHGSAIFLEFGRLRPAPEASTGSEQGDYTVMIEWSWRIEDENSILCGSWSDEDIWEKTFPSLVGRTVTNVSLFGRLPELSIALSGGLNVVSFMTAEGQPMWTIFDRTSQEAGVQSISVENGSVTTGL